MDNNNLSGEPKVSRDVIERLKNMKAGGNSYKAVYLACDIKPATFYNYTSKRTELRAEDAVKIDNYLNKIGY